LLVAQELISLRQHLWVWSANH